VYYRSEDFGGMQGVFKKTIPKLYSEHKQIFLTSFPNSCGSQSESHKNRNQTRRNKGGNNYTQEEKCRLNTKEMRVQINLHNEIT